MKFAHKWVWGEAPGPADPDIGEGGGAAGGRQHRSKIWDIFSNLTKVLATICVLL